MSKIHVLDEQLINKIAAGEVVERPASVVKELVENSIDASATNITIEIKEGGISLIRITDNGHGIPREQLKLAFMRHATSKLNTFEDLSNIFTLGFRGEALSSIASVSEVELITKTAADNAGTKIEISGGQIISERETAAVCGTIFTVRNLFYNTPARRNFLKKPGTEGGCVTDIVTKIALGHPGISIKYINNNTTVLHTSGDGNIKNAVFTVWGKELAGKMIDFTYEKNNYSFKGLIGKPELCRANRSYGNFFINGRFVKSDIIISAVEDAYKGRLMTGKFPVYIIDMAVPPDTVDVNVHPTKLEVRFGNEDEVTELLKTAIEETLKNEILIPRTGWGVQKESSFKNTAGDFSKKTVGDFPKITSANKRYEALNLEESVEISPFEHVSIAEKVYKSQEIKKTPAAPQLQQPQDKKRDLFFKNYKIAGQIFNTYWIIEQNNSLYLIDQHAAHERILYEELLIKLKSGAVASQRLLQPVVVKLNEKENQLLNDNKTLFNIFGFEIDVFGEKNTYAIRAVPYLFKNPVSPDYFFNILDTLADKNITDIYDLKLDSIASISCRAAVKANDKLSYIEAKGLVEKIVQLENPFSCPHGRPTIIEMSRYELEKKFNRV